MDEKERSNLAGLRRQAAEKTPYPNFLERLEEIDSWLKALSTANGSRKRARPGQAISAPRKRPPGLTPEEIEAMMDPDRDLDPRR
ncbi:MAG: hypothetical protein KJN97_00380 [Deltaproteobacteria bacterium]|nr:hypothetical protein [Deltaproteobacteria bacterium]